MPQIASDRVEIVVGWYTRRDGEAVYVTAVEDDYPSSLGLNTYCVIGMTADGRYDRWTRDGGYDEGGPHPMDLIRRN